MCRADYDPPQVSRISAPVARKTHRCSECQRDIPPGERYSYYFSIQDGDCLSFRTCAHCSVGQRWLIEQCNGYICGEVYDDLVEHAREYPAIAMPLSRIVVGMRRKWQGFNGGLMQMPDLPPVIDERSLR